MNNLFSSFIFEIIGAFVVWMVKGFKGKLSDEMSGPYESNRKSWRNTLISFLLLFFIIAVVYKHQENRKKKASDNRLNTTIEKSYIN